MSGGVSCINGAVRVIKWPLSVLSKRKHGGKENGKPLDVSKLQFIKICW